MNIMKIHNYKNNTSTEWQVLPLKNIIKEVKLKNNSKENITVFAITKHSGLVPSLKFFKKKVFSIDLSNYKIIENGQFAYSPIHLNEGAIGLLETQQRGLVSPLHIVFKILPNLHSSFFKILFKTNRFISTCSRFAQGSVHRRGSVSYRDFSNIHVPVPPLVEQRGIVEVIGTVDECISLTDAVVERAEELKRGLLQQLLTRGIGHTEYKETPLGKIPKTWIITRMKELTLDHKQGYYTKEKYVENGVRLIRITDLMNPKISWNTMPRLDVDKKTYEQFKVEKGDFLFARSGAIGRYGIVEDSEKGIFGSYLIRFKFNPEKLNNNYFGYVYSTQKIQNQIQRYKHGSTNININAEDIKFLMIALPEIKEQMEIVQILSDIDKKILTEIEKKENLNLIKQGLIQLLLSGKIRVELKGDGLHRIEDSREANN